MDDIDFALLQNRRGEISEDIDRLTRQGNTLKFQMAEISTPRNGVAVCRAKEKRHLRAAISRNLSTQIDTRCELLQVGLEVDAENARRRPAPAARRRPASAVVPQASSARRGPFDVEAILAKATNLPMGEPLLLRRGPVPVM